MPDFLGIDTSNYTTSAAVFSSDTNEIIQQRKLLPVRHGECGLRQSDAVFHHTNQLSEVIRNLHPERFDIKAVCVSSRPRNAEGSYMPCFLTGKTAAEIITYVTGAELYYTSHQTGHIAAALYSCGRTDLFEKEFIAFHVSGGTTDCLYCNPDKSEIIKAELFSCSLDLKAGQAVDRVGVMMGLDFPCGREIEKLAEKSDRKFKINIKLKNNDCCLSGLENKCAKMLEDGNTREDTAKFCLSFIGETIKAMSFKAAEAFGDIPIVYAGGVMSDKIIRKMIENSFDAYFALPVFSCDNAAGVAIIASEKYGRHFCK
ncbi:MAG: peptidase M22 [Porcipelethomonas sp.]